MRKTSVFQPISYIHPQESGFYYLQSRYYDPNLCRFINADGLASTGQGFLGCNMFAYCNNNPLSSFDPNGFVTISVGFDFAAAFGIRLGISGQIVIDLEGNLGILITGSAGGGTPTASFCDVIYVTSADTIFDLEGVGLSVGGSAAIGVDGTVSELQDGSEVYGVQYSSPIVSVTGIPIEAHGEVTYSHVISLNWLPASKRQNMYNYLLALYNEQIGEGVI